MENQMEPKSDDSECMEIHQCDLCETFFTTASELCEHKKKGHMCEFCDKTYNTVSEKQGHMKKHFKYSKKVNKIHKKSTEKKQHFKCEHCTEKFTNQEQFQFHMKSMKLKHRNICQKPGCEFTTEVLCSWMKHKNAHRVWSSSRVWIHTCEQCGIKCESKQELLIHLTKSHQNQFIRNIRRPHDLKKHGKIELKCELCKIICLTKEKLDNHLVNSHNYYRCELCKKFVSDSYLQVQLHKIKCPGEQNLKAYQKRRLMSKPMTATE